MASDLESAVQKNLDAVMPWVGLYIAAASAAFTLAIVVDAINSFRHKKLWFPCKYSSLNAASLTVLAVALKLPMDLNTVMIKSETDAAAKFMTSISFIFTAVINFMPSLGSMNEKEVLANVMGLAILVVTITANVGIQFFELRGFLKPDTISLFIMIPSTLMLVSFVGLVSLAVTVSAIKRKLKWVYQQKLKAALKEEEALLRRKGVDMDMDMDDRRRQMMKYWVMAESCSPQFVMARSVVCTASSIISCFAFIIFTLVTRIKETNTNRPGESAYGIYTKWMVYIQSIGIGIGAIVALLRWLRIVTFRYSTISCSSFRNEFKIEDYWIQTLRDWRNSFAGLQIRPNRFRKYLHNIKWCVLTLCIGNQVIIVLVSKMLVFFSVFIVRPFLSFFYSKIQMEHSSGGDTEKDLSLSRYVVLLEGEAELPLSFVKSICDQADRIIQEGRKKQPSSLLNLLHKSVNFDGFIGVGEFDSSKIPRLLSQDPADCWTLPVVTLTSIAIALPNISQDKCKQLLSSVREGLSLAKIVEKTLHTSGKLKNVREAARLTWVEVQLYSKWLHIDLKRAFLNCKSSEEVLHGLSDKAEEILTEFKTAVQDPMMEDPVNLPVKVIAANTMYRFCQKILVSSVCEETGEEMLERIFVMIANILAACLTNLPQAITKMCHQDSMEKLEKSVQKAFFILGKTEQVIEAVRQRQRPSLRSSSSSWC